MNNVRPPALTAAVDAPRGAKITSLKDARDIEWLAQREPGAEAVAPGLAFTDAEMAGWDECAPTIEACRVDGHDLPDHGDLWDIPFSAGGDTLQATGESLGYHFTRRIHPIGDGLRLDYSAAALGRPVPFLWAAHPQFVAPPGTRVELPAGIDRVVDVLDPATPELPWSDRLATIDTVDPGGCRKVYVHPDQNARYAQLIRADGAGLELRWSAACPYLGIWYDAGAYSREPVIALEPSTAYFDSLATAVDSGRHPTLVPGRPLTWSLTITSLPARS